MSRHRWGTPGNDPDSREGAVMDRMVIRRGYLPGWTDWSNRRCRWLGHKRCPKPNTNVQGYYICLRGDCPALLPFTTEEVRNG